MDESVPTADGIGGKAGREVKAVRVRLRLRGRRYMYYAKCGLAIVAGIPFAIVGGVLTLSVIGFPIGVPLLAFSGYPLMTVVRKHILEGEVGSLDQGPKPWEN